MTRLSHKRATMRQVGHPWTIITVFEIIHQGPQDIIIFHIQNEKFGVNDENFSMLFLWNLTLKQSKTLFLTNPVF